ncbi:MAG: hypothetical protein NTY77_11500 [Elusimicrobia bacterium]|nr:hypothetical protein [Elusimicrobiota bacterium]
MTELNLDIHGVPVTLSGGPAEVLDDLRRDFEYFFLPFPAEGAIHIELEPRLPERSPEGRPLFRTKDYAVFDRSGIRLIVYADEARAEYDYAAKHGRILCPDPERLHELALLAVLSRAGEALDLKGWHRIHALGFTCGERGGLLLLPSGAGKSTTALELLRATDLGLVSDDTPLIADDLRLMAFPLRLGFAPATELRDVPEKWLRSMRRLRYGIKRLVDLGFFRERVRGGVPVAWILIGERRPGAAPRIEPASRLRAAGALAVHLVVGSGIAQMSEYMLRADLVGSGPALWRGSRSRGRGPPSASCAKPASCAFL